MSFKKTYFLPRGDQQFSCHNENYMLMKNIMFYSCSLLCILLMSSCDDNHGSIPHSPYKFEGALDQIEINWQTPEYDYGTPIATSLPLLEDQKFSIIHSFELRKQRDGRENVITVSTKPLNTTDFDSFFVPGIYDIGEDITVRIAINGMYYGNEEASGALEVQKIDQVDDTRIRVWAKINATLRPVGMIAGPSIQLRDGLLVMEFRRYAGEFD